MGIALSLSMAFVSLLYAGRLKFTVDYYLFQFLGSSSTKAFVDSLIWQPGIAVIYGTFLFLTVLLLFGGIIRAMSIPFRPRIAFPQAFILTVWPLCSLLILVPLSAVLYKFPAAGVSTQLILMMLMAIGIWTAGRIINALRTGFETSIAKAIGISLVTMAVLFSIGYFTIFRWTRIGESIAWFRSVFGNI
jgi:hypothetical protein